MVGGETIGPTGNRKKIPAGDIPAVKAALDIIAAQAKLMGFNAPVNVNLDWQTEIKQAGIDPQVFFEGVVELLMRHQGIEPLLPDNGIYLDPDEMMDGDSAEPGT